jgi:hypothetical protein
LFARTRLQFRDKAIATPKFNVVAVNKLPSLLASGFVIWRKKFVRP